MKEKTKTPLVLTAAQLADCLFEIEVTEEMVQAGLYELNDHRVCELLDEPNYVLEAVFRAMVYAAKEKTS